MKKLTEKEFDRKIQNVIATQGLEDIVLTDGEVLLLKDYFTGKITEDEYYVKVRELINVI
ncbi:MAG: hypothetical protein AB7V16_11380 [Vulcanibacillus sp.]